MKSSGLVVLLPAVLLARLAAAQGSPLPQFDLDRLDVNSSTLGSMVVGTGETLPAGTVRFSLAGDYENDPLVYYQDGQLVGPVISDRFTVHAVGAWAPFDWLQFGLDLPIIASQTGVNLEDYGIPLPTRRAIRSPAVTATARLTNQSQGALLDSALELGVRLPIGTDGAWAKDEKIGVAPKLMIGRHFGWLLAGGELGVRLSPATGDPVVDEANNHFLLAGVLSAGDPAGFRVEASARTTLSFTGHTGPAELLAGARYSLGWIEFFALAGPSVGPRAEGTPEFRVMTGVAFGSVPGVTTPLPATNEIPASTSMPAGGPPAGVTGSGGTWR